MNCCDIAILWAIASSCQGSCQRQSHQEASCGSCGQIEPGPVFRYGEQNNSCGCRQNSGC